MAEFTPAAGAMDSSSSGVSDATWDSLDVAAVTKAVPAWRRHASIGVGG